MVEMIDPARCDGDESVLEHWVVTSAGLAVTDCSSEDRLQETGTCWPTAVNQVVSSCSLLVSEFESWSSRPTQSFQSNKQARASSPLPISVTSRPETLAHARFE